MDTLQLVTFMNIASERSFIRASQKLGVSQPAVTARIQSLEDELGVHLIIRTGQEAILTPSGEIFLSYVDRALQVFQSGVDRLNYERLSSGLRVAGTPTFNSYVLPEKLSDFYKEYPNIRLKVLTGTTQEILRMLQDEVADVGFIQGSMSSSHITTYPVFSEELNLLVHRDHPLFRRDIIRLTDLRDEPIVTYRRGSHSWDLIEDRFKQEAFKPGQVMEMDHVSGIRQMLLAGVGVAFLPKRVMVEEIRRKQVKVLELEGPAIVRHTSIAVPNRALSSSAAALLGYIHRIFRLSQLPAEIKRLLSL
jgi:DNA-binding transcriptional LysR family regulator